MTRLYTATCRRCKEVAVIRIATATHGFFLILNSHLVFHKLCKYVSWNGDLSEAALCFHRCFHDMCAVPTRKIVVPFCLTLFDSLQGTTNFHCLLLKVDVQEFYNQKFQSGSKRGGGLSPKTLRNMHNMFHQAMEQARINGMIAVNPTDGTTLPRREQNEMRVLSLEEERRLLSVIGMHRLGMAILFDLATGLRIGELCALKWSDIRRSNLLNGITAKTRIDMVVNVPLIADIGGRLNSILRIGLQPLCHPVAEQVLRGGNVCTRLLLHQNIPYFVCYFFSSFTVDRTLDLLSSIIVTVVSALRRMAFFALR